MTRRAVSPSYPRVVLGEELRRVREDLGLSQGDVAAAVPCHQTKIARFETAQIQTIKMNELDAILARLGIGGAPANELRRFAAMPYEDRGAWTAQSLGDSLWHQGKLRAETLASSIFSVQFDAHDGLTQGSRYMQRQFFLFGRSDIEKASGARVARQEAVFNKPTPPKCVFILCEGALYRDMNDPAMMIDQLEHVQRMKRSGVAEVYILGFSAELPTQTYGFTLMQFDSAVMTDSAFVEHRHGAVVFDEPEVVRDYLKDKKDILNACHDDKGTDACIQRAIDYHRKKVKEVSDG